MSGWLRALLLAVALMVGTWALLLLLVRRLAPGLLRDLAGRCPARCWSPHGQVSPGCWSAWSVVHAQRPASNGAEPVCS
jgi:hypothetical protein